MIAAEIIRRMSGGYWLRVAGASLAGTALVFAVLPPPSSGSMLALIVRALVHATLLGTLCGVVVRWVYRRSEARSFAVRMTFTVGTLLGLATVSTLLARGLFSVTGLDAGQLFWPSFAR